MRIYPLGALNVLTKIHGDPVWTKVVDQHCHLQSHAKCIG